MKKKVDFKGSISEKITKVEQEVLHLLTNEFLTVKKIAIRRNTSVQAIYKVLKSLKQKGIINNHFRKVENIACTFKPQKIRLHGQEYRVNILFKDTRYKDLLKKNNILNIDGSTIKLYNDSLEIYIGPSFYADDPQKATSDSIIYFNRLLTRLENDLKIILVKPRVHNIKQVKEGHYAETNNELAQECLKKADKIRLRTTDDCKVWFTIDNSFNMTEAETQHPTTSKYDMQEIVQPFFNDLRDNEACTLSDIKKVMQEITHIHKETAAGLNAVVNFLQTQLPKNELKDNDTQLDYGKPSYVG